MSATAARASATNDLPRRRSTPEPEPLAVRLYEVLGIVPVLFIVVYGAARSWSTVVSEVPTLLAWLLLVCVAELMAVSLVAPVQLTMSLPVLLAAAMTFPPYVACLLGFLGTTDPRLFTRQISVLRGLFNRSSVALAVFAASLVFHSLGGDLGAWPAVMGIALLALMTDAIINASLTAIGVHLLTRRSLSLVLAGMFDLGHPRLFIIGYTCLGFLGLPMATVFAIGGSWALVALVVPIFLAQQMFEHRQRLSEAEEQISEKSQMLLTVSERIADERREERMHVAADLHDEVLPPLYKVHLMGQVLRQDLATGQLLALEDDLPDLLSATDEASDSMRALIGSLRRSPLGTAGLARTLVLLARQLESESSVKIRTEIQEVGGSPLTQLLAYQVAREALHNAVRHSGTGEIRLSLFNDSECLRLVVEDDGRGFDSDANAGGHHFGLSLMRERTEIAGGVLQIESAPSRGTRVSARFPAGEALR